MSDSLLIVAGALTSLILWFSWIIFAIWHVDGEESAALGWKVVILMILIFVSTAIVININ